MISKNKVFSIDTIRGLAALSVCLFHFANTSLHFTGNTSWYKQFASFGWLGVEAFFVVSGFVIPYSLLSNNYKIYQFPKFFLKRCLRIEPPYILSIFLVIILNYLVSFSPAFKGAAFKIDLVQVLLHFAYLTEHFGYQLLQPVFWTLEAEFQFYIIIGLVIPFAIRNKFSIYLFLFVLLITALVFPLNIFKYMPFFVMGISACFYMKKYLQFYEYLFFIFMSSIFVYQTNQLAVCMVVGLSVSLIICFTNIRSRVTDFLGKISFSLYLVHIPIGSKILNYGSRYANTDLKIYGFLIFSLIFTISFAWVFFKLVEQPSLRWSSKINYKIT